MARKILIVLPAVFLVGFIAACGYGPTPIQFEPVTLDPSQLAFLTLVWGIG